MKYFYTIVALFLLHLSAFAQITTQPSNSTVCETANTSFAIAINAANTSPSFQWQFFNGSAWVNLTNTATYSGVTTKTLTLTAVSFSLNDILYRCLLDSSSIFVATSDSAKLTVNKAPAITSQPSNSNVCESASMAFGLTATGTALTYQWRVFTGANGWIDISAAGSNPTYSNFTTKTLGVGGVAVGNNAYQYSCIVSGTCSPKDTSSIAILTVNTAPALSSQPNSNTICETKNTTFSVAATGTALTYQWQVNTTGSWSNITAAGSNPTYANFTTTTLGVNSTIASNNGHLDRCVVSGTCTPAATSNAATLTINTAPAITSQPSGSTICETKNTTFSVSATGTALTYQWQVNTSGSWSNITAAGSNPTYANFTTTTLGVNSTIASNNGHQYRCIVSGTCTPAATSNAATLTINTAPSISSQPNNSTICENTSTTLGVTATGTSLTYLWRVFTGTGNWVNITTAGSNPTYSNFNTNTLGVSTVVANNSGYQYSCIVSGTCTPKDTSIVATLTVNTSPSITSHPSDATLCSGSNTSFQVSANGTALTYQWQVNTGSGWNNITAAGSNPTYANFTTNLLNVNSVIASNNGYQFRCIISGTCQPKDTTDIVSLTVNTVPSITTQPKDYTLCEGKNATFRIVATNANNNSLTYKWQVNTGSGWANISTAGSNPIYSSWTTNTLGVSSVISWNNNYQYRCVVSGVCSPADTSNAATLNVNATPSIAAHPISSALCEGGNTSFQITANGTNLTYQWQVNTGSGWNAITAAGGSPTYSNWDTYLLQANSVANGNNNYQYRCVISNNGCNAATSNAATLKVNTKPTVNAGNDLAICQGLSIGLSASVNGTPPYTYSWSPSSGLNSINTSNPTASPASTTIYLLMVTDSNTCYSSDTVKVTVNSLPTANAGFDAAICAGDSSQLSGNGGATFSWSPNASLSNPTSAATYAKPNATTVYTLTVTDAKGCNSIDDVKIIVNTLPVANAGADVSICIGSSTQLNASGGVYYTWSPANDLNNATIVNPVASPKNSTTYTCIVTDLNGCMSKDELDITVNPLPNASAGADVSICDGGSAVLNASGGKFYAWNPATDLSNASISNPTAQPKSSTSYQLTVTDSIGCVNSDTVNITVNLLPKADAGADVSICEGSSIQLSGSGGATYSWSPSTGLNAANIANPVASPITTQLYVLSIDDNNGCKGKDSVTVTVIVKPTPSFIKADTVVCRNSSWKEYCITPSNNSITWTVDSGNIISGQGSSCIMVQWANVSSGLVSVNERLWNSPYCGNTASKTISMSNGTAPAPANVIAQGSIASRMLLCPFSNYKNYKWGYETKSKPVTKTFTCTGNSWCQYSSIDTIKYSYWVEVGDDTNCLSKSYYNNQPVATSIDSKELESDISIFPNPTNGQLTISSQSIIELIEVFNVLGEKIHSSMHKAQQMTIDLSNQAAGIYVVSIRTNQGIIARKVLRE